MFPPAPRGSRVSAVRNENVSSTALTSSTPTAQPGPLISCGCSSFSTPSKIANRPPTLNSTSATTNAQKYRNVP